MNPDVVSKSDITDNDCPDSAEKDNAIKKFIDENKKNSTLQQEEFEKIEKIGIKIPLNAIHPITNEKLPVFIANFVLMDYGTGAIFGCPAHDQRDLDFANKYKLNVLPVVRPVSYTHLTLPTNREV